MSHDSKQPEHNHTVASATLHLCNCGACGDMHMPVSAAHQLSHFVHWAAPRSLALGLQIIVLSAAVRCLIPTTQKVGSETSAIGAYTHVLQQ